MHAVFRADASAELGGGHVMRCLTLARALESLGWRCAFAVNAAAPAIVPALAERKPLILDDTAEGTAAALRRNWPGGADWLIVDHYGIDGAVETGCRGWAGAVMAIDDLADRRHDCDVLLDQTFGRRAEDYAGLVPEDCRLLTGSAYALLRPAFAAARAGSLTRRQAGDGLRRLLVSLGATDPENHSRDVLEGIARSGLRLAVDVVLGAGARHLDDIRARCAELPQQAELHVDTADMPGLMARADLAIGAAGTSTWERCCLGLPSLLVVIAENQRRIAEAVSAAGAAELLSGRRDGLAERAGTALRRLAAAPAALREMSAKAAAICDGRGGDRIGLALAAPGRARDGRSVSLRLAAPEDENLILEWQRHPTTRKYARNPAVPSPAEHHAWFTRRLAEPDGLLTIITLDGAPAGLLRLDAPAAAGGARPPGSREVSILVDPALRGLGIALEALKFVRRWQGRLTIAAEVLPGNAASAALFEAAGYAPGPDGLLYSLPPQSAMTLSQ